MLGHTGDCLDGSVRLIDGESIYEGYVEVCKDKIWSAVCAEGWGLEEAAVVCGQLGILSTGLCTLTVISISSCDMQVSTL